MQVLDRSDLSPAMPAPAAPPMNAPRPSTESRPQALGPAQLIDALLQIHRQERFAGALTAAAASAAKLAVPAFVGCLLRDPGTAAWHVTALFDPASRPLLLAHAGLPETPFIFTPPAMVTARPLMEVFGQSWGEEGCARVAARLGVTSVICAPIRDAGGLRGALIAFPTGGGPTLLLAGVLVHAATAAARLLDREIALASDGVLDPPTLAGRAAHEIARAARYHRQITVVVFEPGSLTELAQVGPMLVRSLRKWDLLGRVEADRPVLAAILPETGRSGGHGLIRRLSKYLDGIQVGAASFPDDGNNLDQLLAAARSRMTRPAAITEADAATSSADPDPGKGRKKGRPEGEIITSWMRGGPTGPGYDTVRCPRCMASYTRTGPPISDYRLLEHAIVTVRTVLHAQCPHHQPRVSVTV